MASAGQTVRNVVKVDCFQMLQPLFRLAGALPVYFPIAALYQAGKLAHREVGLLGCLCSGKSSSYNIHDGDRNRLCPQETLIRYYYEEKAWDVSGLLNKMESVLFVQFIQNYYLSDSVYQSKTSLFLVATFTLTKL